MLRILRVLCSFSQVLTNEQREDSYCEIVVIWIVGMRLMTLMIRKEVVHDTNRRKGTANGVNDEDRGYQEAEYLVSEFGAVVDNLVEIDKGCNHHVNANPQSDPRIEREEWNIYIDRHTVENLCKCKNWTCSSINHLQGM